jgi:hypothetical protein
MRKIRKPELQVSSVFDACVAIAENRTISVNCLTAKDAVVQAESNYEADALTSDLFQLPRDQDSVGQASKTDLAALYTRLRDNENTRSIYDEIRAGAAPGKCPLPKAHYPLFTITPINLVPSCERCNGKKRDSFPAVRDQQPLHPYFDEFWDERWLFAELNCGIPVSARFFVSAPAAWPADKRRRAEVHFTDLDLETVFITDAADELSGITKELGDVFRDAGPEGLRKHLKRRADSHLAVCPNSWKTALYFACAESDWFCDGGFW